LNKNKDVFAWSAKDLQGVDWDIIKHTLDTDEKITSTKQKLIVFQVVIKFSRVLHVSIFSKI
jgi:hypothetical protein